MEGVFGWREERDFGWIVDILTYGVFNGGILSREFFSVIEFLSAGVCTMRVCIEIKG